MSQASNQVTWCLNKAVKDIEECKKLGKRIKHRGLIEITPNKEIAKKHITKAEHNLRAIHRFQDIGFSDWSITAGFYSIYHCFLALAVTFGFESRNQTCTVALIEKLKEEGKINIDEKFINIIKTDLDDFQESNVIEMREEYTYGIKVSFDDKEKIETLAETCKDMIELTKNIVLG